MTELADYVRNIAVFIIFMTFVSIIVPENKYEKYAKLIMGIVLMGIVISPLAGIVGRLSDSGGFVLNGMPLIDMRQIETQITSASEFQIDSILTAYQADLTTHLRRLVENSSEYSLLDAYFDIGRSEENFGKILGIHLTVSPHPPHNARGLITIDPVRIDISVNTRGLGRQTEQENVENEQMLALKNLIANFYNVDIESIHVSIR